MKYLRKIVLMFFVLSLTLFAKDVATVTALSGEAFVKRDAQTIKISLGDKLQEKDRVITSKKTKIQIIFEDETIITLGKDSDFSISEYLFEDKKTVARFTMLRGAMRTITGKIGKIAPDKFSVTTKTSTIGIRGTNFTVVVGNDGSQNVFCTFGAISVQVRGVGKKYVVRQGFYSHVTADGKVEIKEFTPKQLQDMQKNSFKHTKKESKKTREDGFGISGDEQPKEDSAQGDLIIKDITDQLKEGVQQESAVDLTAKGVALSSYGYPSLLSLDMSYRQDGTSVVNDGRINIRGSDPRLYLLSPTTVFSYGVDTQFYDVLTENVTTVVDMAPETNYFRDLPNIISEDDVLWGEWAIKYDETNGDNTYLVQEHGLWVYGVPTDSAVVNAMQGEFVYIGGFKAYDCNSNDGSIIEGVAKMHVDFGNDKVELLLEHDDDDALFDVDPQMHGNEFVVKQDEHEGGDGVATGRFYGQNAEAVGGEFTVSHDGDVDARGIYQVGNKTPYSGGNNDSEPN